MDDALISSGVVNMFVSVSVVEAAGSGFSRLKSKEGLKERTDSSIASCDWICHRVIL